VKRTEFHAILLFVILILDWQSQVASANHLYKPVRVRYKGFAPQTSPLSCLPRIELPHCRLRAHAASALSTITY
jgi:hypothetical protein